MSDDDNNNSIIIRDGGLTDTLILALEQCKEQDRVSQSYRNTIVNLQRENERLQNELEDERTKSRRMRQLQPQPEPQPQPQPQPQREATATQLEHLFQRTIEQQSEITYLRTKLKSIKAKAKSRGLDEVVTSSPKVPSTVTKSRQNEQDQRPPSVKRGSSDRENENTTGYRHLQGTTGSRGLEHDRNSSPPGKRRRTSSPIGNGYQEHKTKATNTDRGSSFREVIAADKTAAAVMAIAEDGEGGEGDLDKGIVFTTKHKIREQVPGAYERLNDLLSGPAPTSPFVPRASRVNINFGRIPGGGGQLRDTEHKQELKPGSEPDSDVQVSTERSANLATSAGPVISNPTATALTSRNGLMTKLNARKSKPTSTDENPEDDEPLRVRPIDRLNLTHFRVNPKSNDGLDYAYNEVIRGREARKCLPGCTRMECCGAKFRALAATLPSIPGIQTVSDDELLREFLGSGSEERIKGLTRTARENLLHDARTKLLADKFGKMHRNAYERQRSPVGFWGTDMPTSQEKQSSKEIARSRQREEVKQRYLEALKENGRWIFADE